MMRSIGNSLFLLRQTFVGCPSRFLAELASVLLTVCNSILIRIYLVRLILDAVVSGELETALAIILLAMLLDILFSTYENWMNDCFRSGTNIRIHQYYQDMLYQKAAHVSMRFFDNPKYYNQYLLAAQNSNSKAVSLIGLTHDFLITLMEILLSGGLIIGTMDSLFWVAVIPATLYAIFATQYSKTGVQITEENQPHKRKREYVKRIFFLKKYAIDIRSTNLLQPLFFMYEEGVRDSKSVIRRVGKRRFFLFLCMDALFYLQYMAIIFFLTWRALVVKDVSVGAFSMLLASALTLNNNWRFLGRTISGFAEHGMFAKLLRDFLVLEKEDHDMKKRIPPPVSLQELTVDHVNFQYDKTAPSVLSQVCMCFPPGSRVAVIGPNGAGKTTLIKLLTHLYSPDTGQILLGGTDIECFDLDAYRSRFSLIFQDCQIYPFTIAENILFRTPDASDESFVMEALKQVGLYEKVIALPNGIHTFVTKEFSKDGIVLSSGEVQRLALARAIAQNTPFLIMDEPTSSLDPETESAINKIILRLAWNKTVIVVTHRLTTIAGVDFIYLLNQRGVEEAGTHEELMRKGGHYAAIYKLQSKLYSLDNERGGLCKNFRQ